MDNFFRQVRETYCNATDNKYNKAKEIWNNTLKKVILDAASKGKSQISLKDYADETIGYHKYLYAIAKKSGFETDSGIISWECYK